MRCIYCGDYFKQSAFNTSNECDSCYSTALDKILFDEDFKEEVQHLRNKSSKTRAVFYNDDYEDPTED